MDELNYTGNCVPQECADELQDRNSFIRSILDVKAWFNPKTLHPMVESIIYWHDKKISGLLFVAVITFLFVSASFSFLSIIAYGALFLLVAIMLIKVFGIILRMLKFDIDEHILTKILDINPYIPPDLVQETAKTAVPIINTYISNVYRLFLFENMTETFKFALLLCSLAKIGLIFNLTTLLGIIFISLFTLPKFYEVHTQTIDEIIRVVQNVSGNASERFKNALMIGKTRSSTSIRSTDSASATEMS